MNKENSTFEKDALQSIIVDFIFTFLPLVVFILIRILTSKYDNIFLRSDFSFVSMILFGQTIIKLFAGISENENRKKPNKLVFDMSFVISFGLVPSIVILVLIEVGYDNKVLLISQFIWLTASIVVYLFLGTIGNILAKNKIIKDSDLVSDRDNK